MGENTFSTHGTGSVGLKCAKMWLSRTSFPLKNCTSIALSDVMQEPQLELQKPVFLTSWAQTGSVSQVNRLGWASQADRLANHGSATASSSSHSHRHTTSTYMEASVLMQKLQYLH